MTSNLETLRNRWIELVEKENAAIAQNASDVSLRPAVDAAQKAYWEAKNEKLIARYYSERLGMVTIPEN